MKRYLGIANSIFRSKIFFKNPKHYSIVMFDGASFNDLKFVLENHKFKILEVRPNRSKEVYLSISLIILFLMNFKKVIIQSKRSLVTLYLYSLIELIKPKIVITSIDNSKSFLNFQNY